MSRPLQHGQAKEQQKKTPLFGDSAALAPAICLGLMLATIAVYFPVWRFDFVNYDDPDYVSENPRVLGGLTWPGIIWALVKVHSFNWHPLTWLSHMLDVEMFGPGPAGPHAVNVLFHAANAALLFLVLQRMTGAVWRSTLVAALFALHPLRVESVAWISERKDVLSAFFGLLSLWQYAKYAEESKAGRAGFQSRNYRWSLLFFVLALLSKPMLVTLPFLLLLLDCWPLRRIQPGTSGNRFSIAVRQVKEKWPFLLFSGFVCLLTMNAQGRSGAVQALNAYPLAGRVETIFVAYAQYLAKTSWPVNLSCLYLHPGGWPWAEAVPAAAIVFGVTAAAIFLRTKAPFVFTGWFWFLGMLVPVIGLVQAGLQYMADRYTYLPQTGLFLMLAWGLGELAARRRSAAVPVVLLAAILLSGFGALTRLQLSNWQNGETLFRHAIAVDAAGKNYIAYNNLGFYLYKQGELDEAIENYQAALQIKPDFEPARENLGVALLREKRFDEAIACYQTLLRQGVTNAADVSNLGFALAGAGRIDEAAAAFSKALQLAPDLLEARVNLAGCLASQGELEAAAAEYLRALQLAPNDAEIHFELGIVFSREGKKTEAENEFRKALELKPDFSRAREALQKISE